MNTKTYTYSIVILMLVMVTITSMAKYTSSTNTNPGWSIASVLGTDKFSGEWVGISSPEWFQIDLSSHTMNYGKIIGGQIYPAIEGKIEYTTLGDNTISVRVVELSMNGSEVKKFTEQDLIDNPQIESALSFRFTRVKTQEGVMLRVSTMGGTTYLTRL